eukprot:scaffold1630_cov298-Prasinococcus_capsulatus_cf.AAC.8
MPLRCRSGEGTGMKVPHVSCPTPLAFSNGPPGGVKQAARAAARSAHSQAAGEARPATGPCVHLPLPESLAMGTLSTSAFCTSSSTPSLKSRPETLCTPPPRRQRHAMPRPARKEAAGSQGRAAAHGHTSARPYPVRLVDGHAPVPQRVVHRDARRRLGVVRSAKRGDAAAKIAAAYLLRERLALPVAQGEVRVELGDLALGRVLDVEALQLQLHVQLVLPARQRPQRPAPRQALPHAHRLALRLRRAHAAVRPERRARGGVRAADGDGDGKRQRQRQARYLGQHEVPVHAGEDARAGAGEDGEHGDVHADGRQAPREALGRVQHAAAVGAALRALLLLLLLHLVPCTAEQRDPVGRGALAVQPGGRWLTSALQRRAQGGEAQAGVEVRGAAAAREAREVGAAAQELPLARHLEHGQLPRVRARRQRRRQHRHQPQEVRLRVHPVPSLRPRARERTSAPARFQRARQQRDAGRTQRHARRAHQEADEPPEVREGLAVEGGALVLVHHRAHRRQRRHQCQLPQRPAEGRQRAQPAPPRHLRILHHPAHHHNHNPAAQSSVPASLGSWGCLRARGGGRAYEGREILLKGDEGGARRRRWLFLPLLRRRLARRRARGRGRGH